MQLTLLRTAVVNPNPLNEKKKHYQIYYSMCVLHSAGAEFLYNRQAQDGGN